MLPEEHYVQKKRAKVALEKIEGQLKMPGYKHLSKNLKRKKAKYETVLKELEKAEKAEVKATTAGKVPEKSNKEE